MKNFTLCVFMAMIALTSTAQITVTHADYQIDMEGDISNFSAIDLTGSAAVVPQFGADMVWDYSGLSFLYDYYNLTLPGFNPNIPSGNIRAEGEFLVLSATLPAATYYRYDSTGYDLVGYAHAAADLPLASVTGNVLDTLSVKYSASEYMSPLSIIKFPCNYGDSMTNVGKEDHQYVANVAGFGLVDYEINQEKTHTSEYKVDGWGKLVLNNENTMMNDTFEVLLRQRIVTTVDSFFDAVGNQVPGALLNAFGYNQGQSSTIVHYTFYAKGLNNFALSFSTIDNSIVLGRMNRNIFNTQTVGTNVATEPNHIAHTVFPNPVQNHQFQIQFEKTSAKDWQFEMVNITGQVVHQEAFTEGETTVQKRIQLSSDLPKGAYFYSIRNEVGQVIANGRLIL